MSRWGRPTKNKRRRDPRYFLNENLNESFEEYAGMLKGAAVKRAKALGVSPEAVQKSGIGGQLAQMLSYSGKIGYNNRQIEQASAEDQVVMIVNGVDEVDRVIFKIGKQGSA